MKDSGIAWIGEIPKEWEIKQLSSFFIEHKQKNKNLEEQNLLSLSYGRIIQKSIDTKEGLLPESFEGYNIIEPGDIVFRLTDLQNDKRSLRTGLCKERGIITSAYITLRNKSAVNSSYYHYLFHSYDICKVFYGLGDGVRQGMNFSDLKKLLIVLPPLSEQQRIATFLDEKCKEIDALIALQEEMITELQAYKQSVISEAVTKGLNPKVTMKDSGVKWIGEIPEHWALSPLKKIILGSLQYGANESGIIYSQQLPRYVRITDIQDNKLREDLTKQSLPEDKAKDYLLKEGDILFARSGATVGKAFLYKETYGRCAFAGYLIKAVINNSNLPLFIYYFTQSSCYEEWKKQIFIQATIQNIGADKYARLEIPLPPLPEQQAITDYLDTQCTRIDSLIAIKQSKIDSLKEYKKSVIYEYVTGKKEVPATV